MDPKHSYFCGVSSSIYSLTPVFLFFSPCLARLAPHLAAAVTSPRSPPPPNSSQNSTRRWAAAALPLFPLRRPTHDLRPRVDDAAGVAAAAAAVAAVLFSHRKTHVVTPRFRLPILYAAAASTAAYHPAFPAMEDSQKNSTIIHKMILCHQELLKYWSQKHHSCHSSSIVYIYQYFLQTRQSLEGGGISYPNN